MRLQPQQAKNSGCRSITGIAFRGRLTGMTVKELLERVLTWPPSRQQDAVELLLALEAHDGELYHPSDEEWAAIEEGYLQAKRGEAASDDEVAALLAPRQP